MEYPLIVVPSPRFDIQPSTTGSLFIWKRGRFDGSFRCDASPNRLFFNAVYQRE